MWIPNISWVIALIFISVSSDSSVLSFQFTRVSPNVSGFEDFILEDEDEDCSITIYYIIPLHYLIPLHWYLLVCELWYLLYKEEANVCKQFYELYIDYYILSFRCEILLYFISSLFF